MSTIDDIKKALAARKESKTIEFKDLFNGSTRDWCEILKDIFAISNSGGGTMTFGLDSHGIPTGSNVDWILKLDPADLTNKINAYTDYNYADFEIHKVNKSGYELACLILHTAPILLVPSKPGTYPEEGGKQGRAFSAGVVYFRHGAKSEPATTSDLANYIEKCRTDERKSILSEVRRVVKSRRPGKSIPTDEVTITTDSESLPIRLTDNVEAPEFRLVDPDKTYPHRRMDVINIVNKKLGTEKSINQFDIQAIRKVYDIDGKLEYSYKSQFGTRQYSDAFIEFIMTKWSENKSFFEEVRSISKSNQYS